MRVETGFIDSEDTQILSLGRNDLEEETDADRYAQETLIPAKAYQAFKNTRPITVASIKRKR